MSHDSTPLSEPTGIERWQRSSDAVEAQYRERSRPVVERWQHLQQAARAEYEARDREFALQQEILAIDVRLHEIAVEGTYRPRATHPVPDEYVDVAKDLRKGKRQLGGATFRFFSLLFKRAHPNADALSLEVCTLIACRRDLMAALAGIASAPVATEAPGSTTAIWRPIERSIDPPLAAPELPTPPAALEPSAASTVLAEQEILSVVARRQKVHVLRPALATKTAGGR